MAEQLLAEPAEPIDHVRRLLGVYGRALGHLSPWGIPWPLTFALVFPVIAMILATLVWWSRGTAWRVRCEYPITTTGHPCRNHVWGEWQRCHHHRPGASRRGSGQVRKLLRWETVQRGGRVIEREDIRGHGFLRQRSDVRGLLYYRGFSRPPRNVIGFWRTWISERRDGLAQLVAQLRQAGGLRGLLTGAMNSSVRVGVSDRLPQVIWATRSTLLLVTIGLVMVGYSVWRRYGPGELFFNYTATFVFIAAWAVALSGIWAEATAGSRTTRTHGWLRTAAAKTVRWFGSFMVVSVLAGQLIKQTEDTFGRSVALVLLH
ncbi:hypothetical protein ACQP06_05435 [Nocardia sp. CA-136227]|uniref:hypothetical protein n=1 Tax=Nocardia sp. CA-136227 TaxID=3239979 RepID=UPI003D96A7CE